MLTRFTDGGVRRGKNNTLIVHEEQRSTRWRGRATKLDGPFRIVASWPTGTEMFSTPINPDAPHAPVWADAGKNGRVDLVIIRCPYCGAEHRHSIPSDKPITNYLGGRVAQCESVIDAAGFSGIHDYGTEYRLILIEGRPNQDEMDEYFPLVDWPDEDE